MCCFIRINGCFIRNAKVEIYEDPLTANYDVKIAGNDAGVRFPKISARNLFVLLYSSIGDVITSQIDIDYLSADIF
ncbi:hypothetical protein DVH24_009304 [Malus domestica]|uniref:Uncharacterized protein n=1 Tax=Malus domestica TaxID=3750 RepID=A0A498IVR3_MALDO|nr:hypothetical protein DVH24_009304 [Malus domestica]